MIKSILTHYMLLIKRLLRFEEHKGDFYKQHPNEVLLKKHATQRILKTQKPKK